MNRIFKERFSDIDQFSDQIGWNLDFRQLETGSLRISADALRSRHVTLMQVAFSRRFHQVGSAEKGSRTFGIMAADSPSINWCADKLDANDIVNFNGRSGFDGVSNAHHNAFTFAIDEGLLQQLANQLDIDPTLLDQPSHQGKLSSTSPELAQRVRHWCREMQNIADHPDQQIRNNAAENFDNALSTALLDAASRHSPTKSDRKGPRHRQKICRRAIDYLDSNIERPVAVSELCSEAAVSISTLERAFHRQYGIGPKRYISIRRLAAVAKAIARAEHGTVTQIAGRWGYWHMGQFARDFHAFTGRLPSDVLKSDEGSVFPARRTKQKFNSLPSTRVSLRSN